MALCTYSHGQENGIAHIDSALAAGVDKELFQLKTFVLRGDLPSGSLESRDGATHLALAGAYPFLCEQLLEADILHVNGAFDSVACNAAASAGVPAIVEVMHQVEAGGLHPAVDLVVCVSGLVLAAQRHVRSMVIHNGIDTERFSFKPGRREGAKVKVVQVANMSKDVHWELGDILGELADPGVEGLMVGGRKSVAGLPALGVVRDMPSVYHQADLLFLVEKRAAFGLIFAEAMACGALPVVSGDSGAVTFVRHGQNGWVVSVPESRANTLETLRLATEEAAGPRFLRMQLEARSLIERKFSLERMLRAYQDLYSALGRRPRKKPLKAEAWMELALCAQLYVHGNPDTLTALENYLAETRPLEPCFLRHPVGDAALRIVLEYLCPDLIKKGYAPLASLLCSRLRRSRCVHPLLDEIEKILRKH